MARAKRTSTVDPNETKRQKFARLANSRVNNAYRQLASLGKLGTSAYERTDNDVKKIREILLREVNVACDKLAPSAAGAKNATGLGNIIE